MAAWSAAQRGACRSIGFVPTMGALHPGHLALVSAAQARCERVVVSIFVNPLQFNDPRDLERYPRQVEEDVLLLEQVGAHVLFLPENEELYEGMLPVKRDLAGLDSVWEGPLRPGHFEGMLNAVERLFHFVRPEHAFFGEKDRQQLTIIKHVARQEHWPEQVSSVTTLRESDGLAMSSRNRLLGPGDRTLAASLYKALKVMEEMAQSHSLDQALEKAHGLLRSSARLTLEYLAFADPEDLRPVNEWGTRDTLIALVAARIGEVRLIDNLTVKRQRTHA
ncbi:MAG: pantoate--beta-alanine ligase [Flavobacteriales bacterium]|nr:pantoate--beta-alanine ligase [Flavobacteriales bacterium]